jgi:multiple antibiotic resistance protein
VRELGTTSVSAEEIKEFAGRYDPQPFHVDEEAGRRSLFGGLCASGWQTCALAMRLTVDHLLKDSGQPGFARAGEPQVAQARVSGDQLSLRHTTLESRACASGPPSGMVRLPVGAVQPEGDKVLEMDGYGFFGRRHPATPEELAPWTRRARRLMEFKPLITLLAIVNPLAIVPFFIHYTEGLPAEHQRRTIWVSSFTAFVVIAASALLGVGILEFFGISLASFQVGGGMLLLISALNMLNAKPAEVKPASNEMSDGHEKAAMGASIAVVPLTIPLLTGPATMSAVVIYAERAKTVWQMVTLLGYGVVIGLVTAPVLLSGATHRARAGPHRHQRDDAPDGP